MVPFFNGLDEEEASILLRCATGYFEAFGVVYGLASDDVSGLAVFERFGVDFPSDFVSRDQVFFCRACLYQSMVYFVEGGESLLFSALL